jgi:putative phosphoesterase
MKLGVISDIHGNDIALAAVLEFLLPRTGRIVCAGDITGYYTRPSSCLALLREHHIPFICGNHDKYLFTAPDTLCGDHRQSLAMTASLLSADDMATLERTACHTDIEIAGLRVSLTHGGPNDPCNEYVYPDSDHSHCFATGADIIIQGHTHWPMTFRKSDKLLLNPGSVGQPRDRRPGASCAVIDTETLVPTFHKIEFDGTPIRKELAQLGLPPYFADYLSLGRRNTL